MVQCMFGRAPVRVLPFAIALAATVLLTGCPQKPSPDAGAGPTSARGTNGASTGPVLAAGTYDLTLEKFKAPWWRDVAGYLSRSGEGAWEGSLRQGGIRARLRITGEGESAKAELVVDSNRDRELSEHPLASESVADGPSLSDKPTRRFVFPETDVAGKRVLLGAETAEANPRSVRLFALRTGCLAARVPAGSPEQVIRVLTDDTAGPGGATLWIDGDDTGFAMPWQTCSTSAVLGFAERLYKVQVTTGDRPKLTIQDFDGETGALVFDATDGRGDKQGVYAPSFSGPVEVQYVGLVQRAQVPAGTLSAHYLLPNNDGGACVARIERPLRVKRGQETTVKAGGAVKLTLDAGGEQDTVQARLALVTAAGDRLVEGVGEEEQAGKVEVLGPDGTVLASGEVGFG